MAVLVSRINFAAGNDNRGSVHRASNAPAEGELGGTDGRADQRQNDRIFCSACS
jgi:hypothetical protein